MHLHLLQHDHFEDLGYIKQWSENQNFTFSVTRFDLAESLPEHSSYDWLIIMGGKMSVNDTGKYQWLLTEIEFIRKAIELNKIVIGICLGSQLIAKALGAEIYTNPEPEMGFWPVYFSSEARSDSVFRHFESGLMVLHMHSDTFSLPENSIMMAWSDACHCQAFRYKENVFAFQFHFELTQENVNRFLNEVEPEMVSGKYTQSKHEMLQHTDNLISNNIVFAKVLDAIIGIDNHS